MKPFRILGRNIRDAFKSIFRNFSLSFASLSCVTITLIVVSISIMLSVNVNNLTTKIEEEVTIVVFLDRDITEERIEEVREEILAIKNVNIKDLVFVDKMEIRQQWMDSSDTYASIMKDWDSRDKNDLQDTYHVKVIEAERIEETAKSIDKIAGVDVVKYGDGMVKQLVNVFTTIRNGSYAVVIALGLVTWFLISNTIKITIFSRKKEIDIMRLVGASNLNIKIPFVLEGLLIGIIGSIVPILVTTYGYTALFDNFNGELFGEWLPLVSPEPFIYYVSLGLLALGGLVGMLGSSRAVRKHLKI